MRYMIFVLILLVLLILLWKNRHRFRLTEEYFQIDIDELHEKYAKYRVMLSLLPILFGPLYAFILCNAFIKLIKFRVGFLTKGVYVFYDPLLIWLTLSTSFGYILSVLTVIGLIRLFLKLDFTHFLKYFNLHYGFNTIKMLKYIALFSLIVMFFIAALYMDHYSIFTENEIIINPVLSLREMRYNYSDIDTIILSKSFIAPNGNTVQKTNLLIKFNDKHIWDANKNRARNVKNLYYDMADFLQNKSSKEVLYVDVLEDYILNR